MPIDTTALGIAKAGTYPLFGLMGYVGLLGSKQIMLNGLLWLMALDTVTGIAMVWWINSDLFKSRTTYRGVMRKFMCLLLIFGIAVFCHSLNMDSDSILRVSFSVLLFAEGISILGNVHSIYTGKLEQELDLVSAVLKFAKDKLYDTGKALVGIKEGAAENEPDKKSD